MMMVKVMGIVMVIMKMGEVGVMMVVVIVMG